MWVNYIRLSRVFLKIAAHVRLTCPVSALIGVDSRLLLVVLD
jgi:hypothetical protein